MSENTVKNHVRNILEKLAHCTRAWRRSCTPCVPSSSSSTDGRQGRPFAPPG
ncbi:hypothetical protein [Nocardioides convexus]|uniref:hypothetical protein n=1 Tax=Nocardioides convexus TaxID=2712224 RepID=UPI00241827AA|nr:hypothetical protein [Nocardioides convexus]